MSLKRSGCSIRFVIYKHIKRIMKYKQANHQVSVSGNDDAPRIDLEDIFDSHQSTLEAVYAKEFCSEVRRMLTGLDAIVFDYLTGNRVVVSPELQSKRHKTAWLRSVAVDLGTSVQIVRLSIRYIKDRLSTVFRLAA
jgi:hypothetical protein